MRRDGRDRRRGFALFAVLVVILLLLAAGALLAIHIQVRHALVRDQERNMRLQNLLDSGYAVAAATVREDFGYFGVLEVEVDGGLVRMEIEPASVAGAASGGRSIAMTATYRGEVRRAVGLLVLPVPGATPRLYGIRPVAASDAGAADDE